MGPAAEALRVRQTLERVDSVAFGVAKDVPLRSMGSEINVLMHSLGTFGVDVSGAADDDGAWSLEPSMGGDDDGNADVVDGGGSEVEIDGSVSSSDETSLTTPAENNEAGGEWLL
jgi:hypothetical protein